VTRNRERARQLRREPTEAEAFLWEQLRGRAFKDLKFRRQFPLGNYIVDFVCLDKLLIIELDGGGHNEDAQRKYDAVRDAWLRSQGFRILRYWNNEVLEEWENVAEGIWKAVKDTPSPPAPLPRGARGEMRDATLPRAARGERKVLR
jgi:very-short-patch-repair endonuclease